MVVCVDESQNVLQVSIHLWTTTTAIDYETSAGYSAVYILCHAR